PKYAISSPLVRCSRVIALRMLASTSSVQCTQPVLASSTYISPSAVAMYRRPPATTGCVPAELAPGKPNAHFSLRCDRSSAVISAASADWNRVLVMPRPQPFQAGPARAFVLGADVELQNADLRISPPESAARRFSDTYSARARRCARLRSATRARIEPFSSDSSNCSALIRFIASRLGACASAVGPSWQIAQYVLYRAAPSCA